MREEVHFFFFFFIFCLKLIKNLNLDVLDGSSFISDKYLTVCSMEEHEQLNLNKFILKSHLLLEVEGETPYTSFHCFRPAKLKTGSQSGGQGNADSPVCLELLCGTGQVAPSLGTGFFICKVRV